MELLLLYILCVEHKGIQLFFEHSLIIIKKKFTIPNLAKGLSDKHGTRTLETLKQYPFLHEKRENTI